MSTAALSVRREFARPVQQQYYEYYHIVSYRSDSKKILLHVCYARCENVAAADSVYHHITSIDSLRRAYTCLSKKNAYARVMRFILLKTTGCYWL